MPSSVRAFATIAIALVVVVLPLHAQRVPAAVYTDPPHDARQPARMEVLHIPSGGVRINGVAYLASGAGQHPTFVLLHGLPGNEKNLDLAQAVRRAGWNAVTFNYRGSWGSPGSFRFAQNLEDADAVLAFLREPANARSLGIDTTQLVLAGHSMGGWVTVRTAAHQHGLRGIVLISAADQVYIRDCCRLGDTKTTCQPPALPFSDGTWAKCMLVMLAICRSWAQVRAEMYICWRAWRPVTGTGGFSGSLGLGGSEQHVSRTQTAATKNGGFMVNPHSGMDRPQWGHELDLAVFIRVNPWPDFFCTNTRSGTS